MHIVRLILAGCWLVFLSPCGASTIPPEVRELAVLTDVVGNETIDDVAAAEPARFRPQPQGYAGGYSRKAAWLRFALEAPAGEWWIDVLPPFLDDIRLYVPDLGHPGKFIERRGGDRLKFDQREVPYRGFIFKIRKTTAEPLVVYLRLETASSSMMVLRAWSPDTFGQAMLLESGLLLGYIGLIFGVLLTSVINWGWVRNDLLGWFIAYLACLWFATVCQSGFVAQYLLPEAPTINDPLIHVAFLLTLAVGSAFYRRLFLIGPRQSVMFNIYRCVGLLALAGIVAYAIGLRVETLQMAASLTIIICLVGCWLSLQPRVKNEPGGGTLIVANLISMLGFLALFLGSHGLLPSNLVLLYGLHASTLGAVIALHMTVGSRLAQEIKAIRIAEMAAQHESEMRQQQTRFAAMVSHELRTPLAIISGSVHMLERLEGESQKNSRWFGKIIQAVQRINELVQKFIDQSHLDLNNLVVARRSVAVHVLVKKVIDGLALPQGRVEFESSGPVFLDGDAVLLSMMISNLIDNALKYSPPDSQIRISLQTLEGSVLLEVSNTATYGPLQLGGEMFKRYVRGDTIGDIPGTGLGLHVIRRIANLHGGQVELVDQPDAAAKDTVIFKVNIPFTVKTE